MKSVVTLLLALLLCGCAHGPVATAEQAITIGKRACAEVVHHMPQSGWYATRMGDHWHVWVSDPEGYHIDVPVNGPRPTGFSDRAFIILPD